GSIKTEKRGLKAAALRLDQRRNGPDVRQRFHGILFARASSDAIDSLPTCRRFYALRGTLEARIPGVCCRGIFPTWHAPLDTARISDPPIHFPLRTEDARGKTASLHHSRRASRLSKRCKKTCYAAQCKCAARIPFLRHVPANLRALFVQRVRWIGVWLCLLRHAPLRDSPFSDETRRITLAEAVSSSPSLQR